MAVRQAALVSDESALEACLRQCAIQIDDLFYFTFILMVNVVAVPHQSRRPKSHTVRCDWVLLALFFPPASERLLALST